ncbi:hypothetical protein L6R49_27125 [Myxococcota bacterium]|nr:hypothetical protein [Myxococcota bacterium]
MRCNPTLLFSLLALACAPKETRRPVESPPSGGGGGTTSGATAPTAAPLPPPGPVGSALDAARLSALQGGPWVDQFGTVLTFKSPVEAETGGKTGSVMGLFCDLGGKSVPCLGLELPTVVADKSTRLLVLVEETPETLTQYKVAEGYYAMGPVPGGQVFTRLGPPPDAERLDEQVRLMLGRDGTPLFCVREGGATLTCGGYAQAVELMPLHSALVERRRVVMVAEIPTLKLCASGLSVVGELSTPAERPLGRVVTPTIPREDHIARITSSVGEGFEITEAFWIDLDGDKKDELLFELGFPASVEGVPARALVGVLDDGRVTRLAQVEAKDSVAAAPRARISGVMDPSVTGVLSVLITFEGGTQSGYTVQRVDSAGKVTRVFERGC